MRISRILQSLSLGILSLATFIGTANAQIVMSNMWPLEPGNVWTYENEIYPDRITTITSQVETGEIVTIFEKNRVDTYHNSGVNTTLHWYLLKDKYGLRATHEKRFDRATGEQVSAWEYYGRNAYILYPWTLTLPHRERSMQSYHENELWQWIMADWQVSYSTDFVSTPYYTGEVIRVAFLEYMFTSNSGYVGFIKENWYFADGLGPVLIEQWNFPYNTYIKTRIVLVDFTEGKVEN